jgi:hypothetical protein
LPTGMDGQRQLLHQTMTKLSKAYRRWLKRLATGMIPDREWPLGFDTRGRLRTEMPILRIVPADPPDRAGGRLARLRARFGNPPHRPAGPDRAPA